MKVMSNFLASTNHLGAIGNGTFLDSGLALLKKHGFFAINAFFATLWTNFFQVSHPRFEWQSYINPNFEKVLGQLIHHFLAMMGRRS